MTGCQQLLRSLQIMCALMNLYVRTEYFSILNEMSLLLKLLLKLAHVVVGGVKYSSELFSGDVFLKD